jgi:peptide/nickel transport system substrate-binding protein
VTPSALSLLALLAGSADTLVVGHLADPVTLFPHRATDLVSQAVVINVCETLVRQRGEDGRVEAALATSWASPDHRAWTFTLRESVRFHDGAPLDAEAVVANFESLRRARGFPGAAERLGPLVVRLLLERPNAALLSTLSQPYFAMQSPRALSGDDAKAVGTGPFRLVAVHTGLIELAADPGYWGGAPRLRRVIFRRFPREDALVAALLAGEVDVTSALGPTRVDELRKRSEISLDSFTGLNVAFLSVNNERPPLDDPRVRQALSRAIDRRALVSRFLAGYGEPARGPLPPSLLGRPGPTRDLVLDVPGAHRLLAEAGLQKGFDTTLLTVDAPRPYMPSPVALAQALRDELLAAGIRVALSQVGSWSEYLARVTRGDYDLALLGWQADSTDPNDFLSALLSAEAIGTTNRSRYRDPAMEALLKRARRESDASARASVYREAQELFHKDMPFVPLYHLSVFTAYGRAVHGLSPGPTGLLRYDKTWKLE